MQQVIIYRGPIEAWYWENPQYVLYLLGGGLLIVILVCVGSTIIEKIKRKHHW